ncbi:MAG: ATP-binding protein, partial [Dechloromonas sp.]|nr:ATP-binding protein [Dechloromonas sp.]
THAVPMRDNDGTISGILAVTRDISERKRAEAELEMHRRHLEELVEKRTTALLETEARASHVIQSSADGLYGIDNDGRITFINPAACDLLGYSAEQVIGKNCHETFHHSHEDGSPYPLCECPSMQSMQSGETTRVDTEVYWHADGHPIPVMYSTHPMIQDGRIVGAVTSFVDISQQRAAAEARERALAAAEHLARVRSEFLANMSHEIRTPLNGVLGFAEIGFRNYQNSAKALDAFTKIKMSGTRLLGVINDVLDFSKIEAGKMRIEQTDIVIAEIINHAVELIRERANAKQLALDIQMAGDLPARCQSDPLRLNQILLNVLSNAVKFTERGRVALHAGRVGDRLSITVTDTGIGMNESQLSELFSPFHQADAAATRRFGGTGLGLAISKRIAELMHGDIRVESQKGIGTTVRIDLPCIPCKGMAIEEPTSTAPLHGEEQPLRGTRILVAEDDAINQAVLQEHLQPSGAQIVMVSSGREAVERVQQDGPSAYDVVLMDVQMPDMDGYEATRRIRAIAPDLPVIAQTAHAFNEEREKCLAAGMVGHLAKPIDCMALTKLVREHVVIAGNSNASTRGTSP